MEFEDKLELSLTRNGKDLFRMDVGELDVDAVMRLTEVAINNARSKKPSSRTSLTSTPTISLPNATLTHNNQNRLTEVARNAGLPNNLSDKIYPILHAVYATGGNTKNFKEILSFLKTLPSFKPPTDVEQAVRYQFRQMKKAGILEDSSQGGDSSQSKQLTERGRILAQAIASQSGNMPNLFQTTN
jgi:hypothetical protein